MSTLAHFQNSVVIPTFFLMGTKLGLLNSMVADSSILNEQGCPQGNYSFHAEQENLLSGQRRISASSKHTQTVE